MADSSQAVILKYIEIVHSAVLTGDLAVRFGPLKKPRYLAAAKSGRSDDKAEIEMQSGRCETHDNTSSREEIKSVIEQIVDVEKQLIYFSHEYGHHLTNDPLYDVALKHCLTRPVRRRKIKFICIVLREEFLSWWTGFRELRKVNYRVGFLALAIGCWSFLGYAICIPLAPVKRPLNRTD
jgi:hypothetical protein